MKVEVVRSHFAYDKSLSLHVAFTPAKALLGKYVVSNRIKWKLRLPRNICLFLYRNL